MNWKTRATIIMAGAALACAMPAAAAVIDFDDLAGDARMIANGYAGLDWDNFYVLNPLVDMPDSGYNFAATSGTNIAYSGYDAPAAIAGLAGKRLESGYFTAAYSDGMTVSARAFNGDVLVHEKDFLVTTTGATRIDFGWSGITRVAFSSSGGIDQMFDMSGSNFAIDDIAFSDFGAVPEPASWAMMIAGFSVIGGMLRARRRPAMA